VNGGYSSKFNAPRQPATAKSIVSGVKIARVNNRLFGPKTKMTAGIISNADHRHVKILSKVSSVKE
jgi:hypothetical protein